MSAPFTNRHSLPVVSESFVAALVIILFILGCPSTVFWSVIAIVVDSVKGDVFGCPLTHISQKVFKRFDPSFAYFYAPCPVSRILRKPGIEASALHCIPRGISQRVGMSVRGRAFVFEAAATLRQAANQLGTANSLLCAAITAAQPGAAAIRDISDHNPAVESLPGQVFFRFDSPVVSGRFLVSHVVNLLNRFPMWLDPSSRVSGLLGRTYFTTKISEFLKKTRASILLSEVSYARRP